MGKRIVVAITLLFGVLLVACGSAPATLATGDSVAADSVVLELPETARLSGEWGIVGLWKDSEPVELRSQTIIIEGRRLGGFDGCNGHGSGLFFARSDGALRVESGISEAVGCESESLEVYGESFRSTAWALTDEGNLVLTNGSAQAEYELTEPLDGISTPDGLDLPLTTLWKSPRPADYNSFGSGRPSGVAIAISGDEAAVTIDGCDNASFDVTYDQSGEGDIDFVLNSSGDYSSCGNDHAVTVLAYLERAEYFLSVRNTDESAIGLWDGQAPLATFATE